MEREQDQPQQLEAGPGKREQDDDIEQGPGADVYEEEEQQMDANKEPG